MHLQASLFSGPAAQEEHKAHQSCTRVCVEQEISVASTIDECHHPVGCSANFSEGVF